MSPSVTYQIKLPIKNDRIIAAMPVPITIKNKAPISEAARMQRPKTMNAITRKKKPVAILYPASWNRFIIFSYASIDQ